jgi:hypothetical protein
MARERAPVGVADVPVAEEHAHPFGHDGHAEERGLRRDVVDVARPRGVGPAQAVVDQEGVLERRAGAFHLGRGAGEDAAPALLDEAAGRLPGARGVVRPGVKRADAVLADHVEREALDRVMIEDQARRDDEEVVVQRLAALGRDGLRLGIDGRDPRGDQVTPSGSQSVVWLTT